MTGSGTQQSPYVPDNWAELKTAAETYNAYIKLASDTQWDMNDQYPEDTPGLELICAEIDFNNALIKNLRKSSGNLFTMSTGDHDVVVKNVNFSSAYITDATVFFGTSNTDSKAIKCRAFGFGGELYNSRFFFCDMRGVEFNGAAISLWLSNSTFTSPDKAITNTQINIEGTVSTGVGTLQLISSALYGDIRALGSQAQLGFAGELCVCDIALQNFNSVYYGGGSPAVLNVSKIGGATVSGNSCIQATSAQMHDAEWLHDAGFPCR